jgi:hypothetical protein
MITAATIPLILLTAWLWRKTKGDLISIVLFLSIFEAASGLNIGGMGVAPWILVLVCGLIFKSIKGGAAPHFMAGINIVSVRLLLVFVVYAILTGLIFPFLFAGVPVNSSHSQNGVATPLEWGMANVAQLCYLLAAVTLFLVAAFSSRDSLKRALTWYMYGCVTASFFAFYQLANAVARVPYPSIVLYSNPRYVIYPAYMINGLWRLNSTFTEASAMAGHLSVGIALCAWDVITHPSRWTSYLSLGLMTVALLLTISTSGYLALILISIVIALVSVRNIFKTRTLHPGHAFVLLIAIACGAFACVATNAPTMVGKVITSVFIEKQSSSSYRERTASNQSAMETARQTYYLGAGWGSVRCSSLGSGLLGTVGIPGATLFLIFLLSLLAPFIRSGRELLRDDLFGKSIFGIFVILAAMMIASNEPVQPILWVLFAGATAGVVIRKSQNDFSKVSYESQSYPRFAKLAAGQTVQSKSDYLLGRHSHGPRWEVRENR